MDTAAHPVSQIYKNCDPNNTNSVHVSSLLNYIKPFMLNNLSELKTLKVQLDPDGTDPVISCDFFQQTMSEWIAKLNKHTCCSDESEKSNSCEGEEANLSSAIFTIGLSPNVSTLSNTCVNNNSIALEEQIQKLQYQLQKTSKELELVKQQLASSEEQNESLLTELNQLRKLHCREQLISEEYAKYKQESEEIKEDANGANKKIQELGKTLLNFEKQNQLLQNQITELEDENGQLKLKVQKLEKERIEKTKLISELEDSVDNKDSEIATFLEVIDELKGKLDEKIELVKFYINENKLSKQKIETLETFFKDMYPDEVFTPKSLEAEIGAFLYNSPKLMYQLAEPVTPSLDSPISFKRCSTSSPIKSANTSVDLFSSIGIATVLRTPHKTLKEELLEVSDPKYNENEVKRLREVLKDQETIKKDLWKSMKNLSHDNEILQEYKQKYEALARSVQEKQDVIEYMKNKINTLTLEKSCAKEDKHTETEFWQERDEVLQNLNQELDRQKVVSAVLAKNLEEERKKIDSYKEKEQLIQQLRNEIQLIEKKYNDEMQKVSVFQGNEKSDKYTETDKDEITWTVPLVNVTESKKTNYSKQQVKLERLLEKQEKLERELNSERGTNVILTTKVREVQEENTQIKELLEFSTDAYNKLMEKMKVLETEYKKLQEDNLNLTKEKFAITRGLQIEKESLINRIHQLDAVTKRHCVKELSLKKQLTDLQATYDSEVLQLKKVLSEKDNQLIELQDQNNNVEEFLCIVNENLTNMMSNISSRYDVDHNMSEIRELEKDIAGNSALIEQVNKLNINVRLVINLFKIMEDQRFKSNDQMFSESYYVSQSISDSSFDEFFDAIFNTSESSVEDENFVSCFSELSDDDYADIISFQTDSFLDNLDLNDCDLRNLSRQEMEDKFTTLALTLTVDFATSKRRYLCQKEKCNQLLIKFFTYLNCTMNLVRQLKPNDEVRINKSLNLLKNISEEVVLSAFRCGVVQYEKRTVNCWNLVVNYVAALSQENRQNNENQRLSGSPNITNTLVPILKQNQIKTNKNYVIQTRLNSWKKFKCCVISFILIVLVLIVLLIFYVDYLCLKHGKRVCPLEWLLSFVVKRIHSHLVL